jgi:hypothetical protein
VWMSRGAVANHIRKHTDLENEIDGTVGVLRDPAEERTGLRPRESSSAAG